MTGPLIWRSSAVMAQASSSALGHCALLAEAAMRTASIAGSSAADAMSARMSFQAYPGRWCVVHGQKLATLKSALT